MGVIPLGVKSSFNFFLKLNDAKKEHHFSCFFILFNFKIKLKDDMPCICFHPPLAGTRALFHTQSALTSSLLHYHSYITSNSFGD